MSESFITIGTTRIKKSNIKTFGIGVGQKEPSGLFGVIDGWTSGNGFWGALSDGYIGSKYKYLYVTTYQGDNYQFKESEIDLDESLAELESI